MKTTKLLCLPYAGGSASMYLEWEKFLSPSIEVVPLELAGRGRRINQSLYTSVEEAIDDILKMAEEHIKEGSYAIFGHSMGAMLAYELAMKIREKGWNEPVHLFFSGRGAPDVTPNDKKDYHLLEDEEFKLKLKDMGGTPPEFFKYPELVELFIPLLRNDFKIASTYFTERTPMPFSCNFSIFIGKEEDISAKSAEGWKKHTLGICSVYYLNGGHFFINKETKSLATLVNRELTESIKIANHTENLILNTI